MELNRLYHRIKALELYSTRLMENLLAGNYRSIFRGQGIEFSEVREYVEGDDLRTVDWNVTSRMGSVYTKTYREERELNILLLIDSSSSMAQGIGASRIQEQLQLLAASLVLAALSNNDRIGGVFFSDKVQEISFPERGKRPAMVFLTRVLNGNDKGGGSNISLALETARDVMTRRGIVFVLSDFKSEGYHKPMATLAKRHDVIPVRFHSADETRLPLRSFFEARDPETGETILIQGSNGRFKRSYQKWWADQNRTWMRDMARIGCPPLEIFPEKDALQELFRYFESRKGIRRIRSRR